LSKFKNLTILPWVAVLLWMALIFYSSAQVAEQSKELSKGVTEAVVETIERVAPSRAAEIDIKRLHHLTRKNAHFFAYLILGILVLNAMRRSGVGGVRVVLITLLICVLYAVSDEVHQLFVPGRGGQISDVLIDSAGAAIGILVYLGLVKLRKRHE